MAVKELITTVTLSSLATSVDISSIPQGYTDLELLVSLRNTGTYEHLKFSINGAGTSITGRYLNGGGGGTPGAGAYAQYLGNSTRDAYTAGTFGNAHVYITNYSSTTGYKSIISETVAENNNSTANATSQVMAANVFSSNTAITSLSFFNEGSANINIGSSISVYGIRKGSDGTTTVA